MTAGNKLSRIIAVFLCVFLTSGLLLFAFPAKEAYAAGSYRDYWFGSYSERSNQCVLQFKFWNLKSGSKVEVEIGLKKTAERRSLYITRARESISKTLTRKKVLLKLR